MKPKYKLGTMIRVRIGRDDDGATVSGVVHAVIECTTGNAYRIDSEDVEYSEDNIVGAFKPVTVRKSKPAKVRIKKPKQEVVESGFSV